MLPIEEAIAFLQDRAGCRDEAGARTLADALGRLPLALDHAAAACKRTQISFAAYTTKASSLIAAAPRGAGYPRSVAATFNLAIDDAVRQCPAAETLMAFLAHCAPERIPMTLVEGAIDDEAERVAALAALSEMSLIKHDPFDDGTPAVTVHRLVQAVARARANAKTTAQRAIECLIARLVTIYPEDGYNNPKSWPRCAPLTPHFLANSETEMAGAAANAQRAVLLIRAGSYFHGRTAYSERGRFTSARWRSTRKCLAPTIPIHRRASTTLRSCLRTRATLQGHGHSRNAHWRSARKCSAPSIPKRQNASATSPSRLRTRATLQGHGRSRNARWRSPRKCSAPNIPSQRHPSGASPCCFRPRATLAGRGRFTSARWLSARRYSAPSTPYSL